MAWESYLKLSWADRWLLHEELALIIESSDGDDDDPPMRPKDYRK